MKTYKKIFLGVLVFTMILFLTSCTNSINSFDGFLININRIIITTLIFSFIGVLNYILWLFLYDYEDFFFNKRIFFYFGYLLLWLILCYILLFSGNDTITLITIFNILTPLWQKASLNVILIRLSVLIPLILIHIPYLYLLPKHALGLEWGHGIFGYQPYYQKSSRFQGSWLYAIGIGILILILIILTTINTYFLTYHIKISPFEFTILTSILFLSSIILALFIVRNWEKIEKFILWLKRWFFFYYKKSRNIFEVFSYYRAFEIKCNMDGYKKFLHKYSSGPFSGDAKEMFERHKKYAKEQRDYIFNSLNYDIKCEVKIDETKDGICLLAISHLIRGRSTYDNSPYLSVLNNSIEAILEEVNNRIAGIVKRIVEKSSEVTVKEITIELKHGIRKGNQNKSSTIYSATISGKKAKKWYVSNRKISSYLSVTTNLIPQLLIQYEFRNR